jgi:hypothetical protein
VQIRMSRNLKKIAGLSVTLTTGAFMLASYGTFWHVPLSLTLVGVAGLIIGIGLVGWGTLEERKPSVSTGHTELETR